MFAGIGMVMRLFGRDAMQKRFDRNAKTYWRDPNQPTDPKRYYRQF
jgi:hypothetical protein